MTVQMTSGSGSIEARHGKPGPFIGNSLVTIRRPVMAGKLKPAIYRVHCISKQKEQLVTSILVLASQERDPARLEKLTLGLMAKDNLQK